MNQTTIPPNKDLQQLVLYHAVQREFEWGNIYSVFGPEPNALFIAKQSGCQLIFKSSQSRIPSSLIAREAYGIEDDGWHVMAILIGENKEDQIRARDEIYRRFGCTKIEKGFVAPNLKKIF